MSHYDSYYGGGGGGFLQGGSPFSQSGSPGGAQKSEAAMSLRPINGRLFAQAEQAHGDAPWTLDGFEIGHVTVVGIVLSMQQQTTNHAYVINDGYGLLEARRWVGTAGSTEAEMEKWSDIQEGIYVRVSGFMKSFGNKKYINASYMRPITDSNEVFYHLAECITVSLTLQRGPPHNFGIAQQRSISDGSSAYQLNNDVTRDEYSNLPQLQQQVVRFLITQDDKNGVHIGVIARSLAGKVNAEELSEVIGWLMDSGYLYNTIDDNHYALSR
ncbi:Replication factor A protein 2 [Leucoagaricus gongylophorus]